MTRDEHRNSAALIVVISATLSATIIVSGELLSRAQHRVDASVAKVERFDQLCMGVGIRLEIAAREIERGDYTNVRRMLDYDYEILDACAVMPLVPVDVDRRDWCWINDDMPCLARELRNIAKQMPQRDP